MTAGPSPLEGQHAPPSTRDRARITTCLIMWGYRMRHILGNYRSHPTSSTRCFVSRDASWAVARGTNVFNGHRRSIIRSPSRTILSVDAASRPISAYQARGPLRTGLAANFKLLSPGNERNSRPGMQATRSQVAVETIPEFTVSADLSDSFGPGGDFRDAGAPGLTAALFRKWTPRPDRQGRWSPSGPDEFLIFGFDSLVRI